MAAAPKTFLSKASRYTAKAIRPINPIALTSESAVLLPIAFHLAACSAGAQMHKIFPWLHRAEPAIESQVFVSRPGIQIDGRRIGILAFPNGQEGEPVPPPFASFLRNALLVSETPGSVVDVPDPAGYVMEAERDRLSDARRTTLALDHSKAACVDLLATGRVDALYRTASGGMVIKISAQLWDVGARTQVWSGRISVNWIRRYPLEDCLLRAALVLVEEWSREAAADNEGAERSPEAAVCQKPRRSFRPAPRAAVVPF